MNSAIARSQSHTVTLPAALDFDVAATLSRTLDNCRGEDVVIDASYGPLSRRTERLRSRPQLRLTFTKPSRRCCRRGRRFLLTTALSEHGYILMDARSWFS